MSPSADDEGEQDAHGEEQLEEGPQGPSDGRLGYLTDVHRRGDANTTWKEGVTNIIKRKEFIVCFLLVKYILFLLT